MPLPAIIAGVQAGIGAFQTIKGLFDSNSAEDKIRKLLAKRESYKTPDEIFQIKNATENAAASGYNPTTLNYLTGNVNNAFSKTLSSVQRLGGDPNDAANLFNQQMDAIFKIGADDHTLQTQNFSKFLGALDSVASNKAAEQKSEQDLLKDQISLESGNLTAANQGVNNGLNTVMGGLSAVAQNSLYKDPNQPPTIPSSTSGNKGYSYEDFMKFKQFGKL